jgi:hypothetical protein
MQPRDIGPEGDAQDAHPCLVISFSLGNMLSIIAQNYVHASRCFWPGQSKGQTIGLTFFIRDSCSHERDSQSHERARFLETLRTLSIYTYYVDT